jgi:hypothetical protein
MNKLMVSFNNAGRFGNWYMEAATAMAYALRYDLNFSMPTGEKKDNFYNPVYCKHLCNPNFNPRTEEVRLWESEHTYKPLPFDESWRYKNIFIEGYRQSEKYFKEYANEIRFLMDYPYEKKEGVVCVHVRRGDYLKLPDKHPYYSELWYERAMKLFDGYKFKFFSDDIAWCREKFGDRSDVEFSTNDHIERDFIEMQCCHHFINSSSTYSWAAAWHCRGEDKKIVTPLKWFTDGYSLDTRDIIPDTWIKL